MHTKFRTLPNAGALFSRSTAQLPNNIASRVVTLKARVRIHAPQGGATTIQLGLTDSTTKHGYIVRAVLYNNGSKSQLGIFPTENNGQTLQIGVANTELQLPTKDSSWHDVKLVWDQTAGVMSSYWDDTLQANHVINVPSQLYKSFNQVVMYGQFNSARVDNLSVSLEPQVIVSVLSWYSPLGALNGLHSFQTNGYLYRAQAGANIANYPLPLQVEYPIDAPVVGGPEFLDLSQKSALESLKLMKQANFDVAAFDMLPWPIYNFDLPRKDDNQPFTHFPVFLRWLQAAPEAKMKVALFADMLNLSGDYPLGSKLDVKQWTSVLMGALDGMKNIDGKDYEGVWKLNDKPAIFHFGTDSSTGAPPSPSASPSAPQPDQGWREVINNVRGSGRSFSFIADVRPRYENLAEWESFVDGAYIFGPAAPTGYFQEAQPLIASKFKNVPFMWSVSPGYYNARIRAYTQPEFSRIHEAYQAAISAHAPYMFVMTWNDFGEDTDIQPSANKGKALLTVFRYYNEWFKARLQPKWNEEHIVLAYPLRIPIQVNTPYTDWGLYKSPSFKPPKMFYWALTLKDRTMTVDGLGEVRLPSGLSFGEVGNVQAGTISVRLDGGTPRVFNSITNTGVETQRGSEGGLEFKYIDLFQNYPSY